MPTRKNRHTSNKGRADEAKRRILIVDDHEVLREGMRLMIDSQPDLVVCGDAADESTAMRLYREHSPDAAIVDIGLQKGNGIELVKRIKMIDSAARMLVYSMHEEELYAERSLRAGAMGYLSKQRPARTMVHALRDVLQGKMYFSPELTQRLLRSMSSGTLPKDTIVSNLSDRELEVFEMLGRGLSTRTIAVHLRLSPRTVDTYRERLKVKLVLPTAAELHYRAVQWVLQGR